MCNSLHIVGWYHCFCCCSASFSSHSSPRKWLDGRRANRQQSSRLFELSTVSSTKPDNIVWLFKHYSLISNCETVIICLLGHSGCLSGLREKTKGNFFSSFSLLLHQAYPGWEPTASTYIWKSADAPVDCGKICTFKNEQSCCDDVWHSASFGGQQESRGEEQIELCWHSSNWFNRREEHRPSPMPGDHWKQLFHKVQKIWVRPFCLSEIYSLIS